MLSDSVLGDDMSLAFRVKRDEEAFAELYRRHVCAIFQFVRSKVPSDDTAEDLTAQVFFKALRSADTYCATGSYSAWLFAIARNCISNWYRMRCRVVTLAETPEVVDPDPCPATAVVDVESREDVLHAVAELPDTQREAITLRYMHDLSIEEIADRTGRTSGAVRILLHRARARLRNEYEGRQD